VKKMKDNKGHKGFITTAFSVWIEMNGTKELCQELQLSRAALHFWKQDGIPLAIIPKVSELTGIDEKTLVWDTYRIKQADTNNYFRRKEKRIKEKQIKESLKADKG